MCATKTKKDGWVNDDMTTPTSSLPHKARLHMLTRCLHAFLKEEGSLDIHAMTFVP